VQPAVLAPEIQQWVEAGVEARLDHAADQDVVVAAFVDTSSSGGSSDTDVKLLTVNPAGSPSSARQVTTVTPVPKQPSASRSVRGSCPLRYSPVLGWSAILAAYNGCGRIHHMTLGLRPPLSRRNFGPPASASLTEVQP
jgi:hypothetical protein